MNRLDRFFTLRLGSGGLIAFLLAKRAVFAIAGLFLVTLITMIVNIGTGEVQISPVDVLKTLFGQGAADHALVIQTFRLPRTISGLLVGAALGLAGALLQGVVRNPLASPDILGISGGASVAAVAFITMLETVSIQWLPLAAFLGALVVSLLLYGLAWKRGVTPFRLVLMGIGIKVTMAALTTMLVVLSPIHLTNKAMIWLTGSLYGTTWTDVMLLLPWVAALFLFAIICARDLNALQLGESVAAGIGSAVQRQQFQLLFICVGLTGAAVAIGGAIGFVALLAPHIAKQLVGPASETHLPASAIVGAFIVLGGDWIARVAFSPLDIPVGAITSAVGAPFFLYLLYKNRG